MINKLIIYYEILKEIAINRNKLFTLNYSKTLMLLLKVKLRILTTFYFITNKRTEKVN